eukprot:gene7438-8703_t
MLDITIVDQELQDNSIEHFTTIRCLTDVLLWENKINGKVSLATGNKNCSGVDSSSNYDSFREQKQ